MSDREEPSARPESSAEWNRSTRAGIVWSLATFAGGRVFTFVSILVLARLLAPSDFGVLAAILVYLTFLELGADLGMKATVIYEQEKGVTDRVQTAFTTNLAIATTLTAAGVLAAPLIAGFFRLEGETDLFRLGALSLLLTGIGNIHDSLLLRDMDFRRRVKPLLGRALVRGAVSIALAVAGLGASALVIGMLAGSAAWSVLQWRATRFRPNFSLDVGILRSMAGYGSTAALLGVLALVATRVDAVTIGRVLGERALGLYTIAFRVPELLIESVSVNTSLVAFSALSRQRAVDRGALAGAALRLLRYQALYSLPMAAGLAVLAPPLAVTLFSAKWQAAGGVMSAIAVMAGIYTLAFPLGEVFRAVGKQPILVALNVIQIPLLVGAIVAVASSGILAVAWTRAGATIVHAGLVFASVMYILRLAPREVAAALGPGVAASAGVVAGAGTVRLVWGDLSILPLMAGIGLGVLGGFLVLWIAAPVALGQLRRQIAGVARLGRPAVESGR